MKDQLQKNVELVANHKLSGNYLAMVVDDRDPNDWGRVKVRIFGVHSEFSDDESGSDSDFDFLNAIPDVDLPWAAQALSITRSGGENSVFNHGNDTAVKTGFNHTGTGGLFSIPRIGSHVWVFFHNGHHMHPKIFAMAPQKLDWVRQKQKIQKVLDNKIQQIKKFNPKFVPVNVPENGTDWASNATINVQGKKIYDDTQLKLKESYQKETGKKWTNAPDLDVRLLRDKENFSTAFPYESDQADKGKQTMRNVECFTSRSGTTILIDRTDGEETMYKIHKNYMQILDQNGSRKVFIGRNQDLLDEKIGDDENPPVNPDIRCNDERNVDGDVKDHILGNWNQYVKGMYNVQVDKCVEMDINESVGVVIRKGDLDIVIQGFEGTTGREDEATHTAEGEKASDWNGSTQRGSINIDVQQGDVEMHVGRNVNLHVDKDVNMLVDGNVRMHVLKDYHLHVEGNYHEHINGEKYSYTDKHSEVKIGQHLREQIGTDRETVIGSNDKLTIGSNMAINVGGGSGITSGGILSVSQSTMTVNSDINVSSTGSFDGKLSAPTIAASSSLSVAMTEMATHMHTGNLGIPTPIIPGGGDSADSPNISPSPIASPPSPKNVQVVDAIRDTKEA
jgi:hypothetical protein